jgi:hypothetical protein
MSETIEETRVRCMKMSHDRRDFTALEDGFYRYWPKRDSLGAIAAHELRWLADELDKMNAPLEEELNNFFTEHTE